MTDTNPGSGGLSDGGLSDGGLLSRVAEVYAAADPVPEVVLAAAVAAGGWRGIDAELAEMVADSASELVSLRSVSDEDRRHVSFRAPGVEIEVTVIDESLRRLVGQLVPAGEADLVLTADSGEIHEVRSDTLGRFAFERVSRGPVSLTLRLADPAGRPRLIRTDWIL